MLNATALITSFLLLLIFIYLIKKNLIKPGFMFPWFFIIILLGVVSLNDHFIGFFARILGIKTGPLAIILALLFIIIISYLSLAIAITKIYHRQLLIIRYIAEKELEKDDVSQ
jgi:hypothetical protein